jgi:DnaD/phage-associated family protein
MQFITDKTAMTEIPTQFITSAMWDATAAQIKVYLALISGEYDDASQIGAICGEPCVMQIIRYWEEKGYIKVEDNGQIFSLSFPTPDKKTQPVSTSGIISRAEQWKGAPLSASDLETILYIRDSLKFSEELEAYLFDYCSEQKNIKYLQKVALGWHERNITTPGQVAKVKKYDSRIYETLKSLGRSGQPTDTEAEFILNWYNMYSNELITEACKRTAIATDKSRLMYADRMLKNWNTAGIKTLYELQDYEKSNGYGKAKDKYMKHNYDFAEIEKDLLSN